MSKFRGARASLAILLCAGTLAGCGGSDDGGGGTGSGSGSGDGAPLKVALLPPSGGALAQMGADAVKGWKYAAAEANAAGGVDGHPVELVVAQTDGTPAATVRAARRAVTQDGARFVSGVITSPEHGALQQQLPSMNAISLLGLGKDDALTGEGCSANAFRAVHSTEMETNALAAVLPKLPGDRWAVIAVDYSTGHSAAKNFAAAAKAAGKQVVTQEFVPLNTTDFGAYITRISRSKADALFALVPGADGVTFIKQAEQFKLFDGLKTVYGFQMISEPALDALGERVHGFYTNVGYDVDSDDPRNRKFVEGYERQFGSAPYSVPADHYLAAQMLFEAVRKAKSVDPEAVREALSGLAFESFAGPVKVAADHQLVRSAYVGRVETGKDGPRIAVAEEIPGDRAHPRPNPDCVL